MRPLAITIFCSGEGVDELAGVAQIVIGLLPQEFQIRAVLPMQVEVLCQPRRSSGRVRVLAPADNLASVEIGGHGDVQSGKPEELLRPFEGRIARLPKPVEVGEALLQMVAALARPRAELCVQVVMIVALPRGKPPIVRGPHRLERDGRSAAPRSRTELVLLQEPLTLDDLVRQPHRGPAPIPVPPLFVRRVHGTEAPGERPLYPLSGNG